MSSSYCYYYFYSSVVVCVMLMLCCFSLFIYLIMFLEIVELMNQDNCIYMVMFGIMYFENTRRKLVLMIMKYHVIYFVPVLFFQPLMNAVI